VRILVLTASGEPLNSIRPEAEMFIGWHRSGEEVTVMSAADNVYMPMWKAAGLNCIDAEPQGKFDLSMIRRLRGMFQEERFDVVYVLNNKAISCAAWAAIGCKVLLVAYRGQTGNIRWFDPSCYLTLLHPRVDAVLCVANAVRDELRRQMRRPQRVVTLYKGHDPQWYRQDPADLQALGIPKDAFVLGCAANLRPRKGVPQLLEALQTLTDLEDLHVLLIGRGMEAASFEQGLSPRVHALGFRTDAPELLSACTATVLPALKREGLPKTVIESMVAGVPVLVTDSGGNAELIEHEVSGLVVAPGDVPALAAGIRRLHQERERLPEMGNAARQRIASTFHVKDSIEQSLRFFRDWLDQA